MPGTRLKNLIVIFSFFVSALLLSACGGRGGGTTPRTGEPGGLEGIGTLFRPVPGRIVSGYGMREHPIYGDYRMHTGVDFEASEGTAIQAAADGTVIFADTQSGYGNLVIIQHARDYQTAYAHCRDLLVNSGQNVTRGAVIATVGATGTATAPHLHFELRVNGEPIDPAPYLSSM